MKVAGRIAFVALVPIFLGWAVLEPEQVAGTVTSRALSAAAIVTPPDDSPAVSPNTAPKDPAPESAESQTDLYGNDVSDAVAEYELDSTGSLYEMHAPQVELPKLGSPKS